MYARDARGPVPRHEHGVRRVSAAVDARADVTRDDAGARQVAAVSAAVERCRRRFRRDGGFGRYRDPIESLQEDRDRCIVGTGTNTS